MHDLNKVTRLKAKQKLVASMMACHYKRKGCFKYSHRDKILSNDLFKRFLVRNMCLSSKILLKWHVFLTKKSPKKVITLNLISRIILKTPLSLEAYLGGLCVLADEVRVSQSFWRCYCARYM